MTKKIIDETFDLLHFSFDGEIEIEEFEGVSVEYNGTNAVIGCCSPVTMARGAFLLAKGICDGQKKFSISQKACFTSCGVMLDMSRNAVMRPRAVKKWISYMAALGLNFLMLYTEDVYELEGYPYFGYMRGRYSKEELKEIVDYAWERGVEVVPCIQTLAHLEQYLKWDEAAEVRDCPDTLMVDEPKTYQFIETMLKTCKEIFRSNRIHIGMDEAHGVGKGAYLKKFGESSQMELFCRHLECVKELCKKYGLEPMMWGDMFFRFNSKIHDYVDLDVEIAPEIAKQADGVDIVYWNFCHTDVYHHDCMMKKHEAFSGETIFAGGIWTWKGYLPRRDYSFASSVAGMKACLKNKIKTVFAPMWNDVGIANHYLALPELATYSEFMYQGEDITYEEVTKTGGFLTRTDPEISNALSLYFYENLGGPVSFDENFGQSYFISGDAFFNSDVFYNATYKMREYYPELLKRYETAIDMLNRHSDHWVARYAILLFSIMKEKLKLHSDLRTAYLSKDKQALAQMCTGLEQLMADYQEFSLLYEEKFMEIYKPFGYELATVKQGGLKQRIEYAYRKLTSYVAGEIDIIEELEEQPQDVPVPFLYLSCMTANGRFF